MPLFAVQLFEQIIMNEIDNVARGTRLRPIILGGVSGHSGGTGSPPGGIIGLLPQTKVAGDTDESFGYSSGSQATLLDNLNNIRNWLLPSHNFWATVPAETDLTPQSCLTVSSGSWHYLDGTSPLIYLGGNSPTISAPSSGSRFDTLIINTSGTLGWIHGTPSVGIPTFPTYPSISSGSMPLWTVLARSSGSAIQRYDDGVSHYIFRDERPFLRGSAGGGHIIEGQSVIVPNRTKLNFVGSGVSVSDDPANDTTIVNIGSSGSIASSGSTPYSFNWYVDGFLSVSSQVDGVRSLPSDFTPLTAEAYLRTPNTSGSTKVNIQYSTDCTTWHSLFSDSNNELTLSSGSCVTRATLAKPLHAGDLLRVDIDSIGANGAGLSVNLIGNELGGGGGGAITSQQTYYLSFNQLPLGGDQLYVFTLQPSVTGTTPVEMDRTMNPGFPDHYVFYSSTAMGVSVLPAGIATLYVRSYHINPADNCNIIFRLISVNAGSLLATGTVIATSSGVALSASPTDYELTINVPATTVSPTQYLVLDIYTDSVDPSFDIFCNGTNRLVMPVAQQLSLPNGEIFVGNSAGIATAVAMSGAVTINNTGVTTATLFGGDAGSGGTPGAVPAPAAGDSLAGKYLKADATWEIPPTGTGHTIQDEGSDLNQRTHLNFTGAGVQATDNAGNNATDVTISGVDATAIHSGDAAGGSLSGTYPNPTVPVFVGSGASHAKGLVPDPGASAGTTKFLREDATFAVPPSSGGGAQLDPSSPIDVGGSAVVGTSGSASHGDHVHRGVTSVSAVGYPYAYGNILFQPGSNITLSQTSGSLTISSSGSSGAGTPLTVASVSGVPSVTNVSTLKVPDGVLIDNGGGVVTLSSQLGLIQQLYRGNVMP